MNNGIKIHAKKYEIIQNQYAKKNYDPDLFSNAKYMKSKKDKIGEFGWLSRLKNYKSLIDY